MVYSSKVERWLTTAPGSPTTHWYQIRCVLQQPLYVMAGQEITGRLHMVAHNAQSYTINLTMSGENFLKNRIVFLFFSKGRLSINLSFLVFSKLKCGDKVQTKTVYSRLLLVSLI